MSLYGESTASNPTHEDWKELLESNYPYLKKELIRDNPLKIDLTELSNVLSSHEQHWKLWLVDYLQRYGRKISITNRFCLKDLSIQSQLKNSEAFSFLVFALLKDISEANIF